MSEHEIELPEASLLPWHQSLWQQFSARRQADNLPHAILLTGAAGLGKQALAAYLTQSLVCTNPNEDFSPCGVCDSCHLSGSGAHPDINWVQPEDAGKAIKVAAIRTLTEKSVLAAQGEQYRVFIINPADAMNVAAANALLKTLEEPAHRTVMLLVSSHAERLPATIRSRCQQLSVSVPEHDDLISWMDNGLSREELEALLAVTANAPMEIARAQEEGWLDRGQKLMQQLDALKQRKVNPMRAKEEWQELELDALLEDLERTVTDLVRISNAEQTKRLYYPRQRTLLQSLGKGIDLKNLYKFVDSLHQLRRQTANNLNAGMLLEKLIIDWLQISKPAAR